MNDGPLSFLKNWEGFLPPNTVLMARRVDSKDAAVPSYRMAFEAPGIEQPALRELFLKIVAAAGMTEAEFHVSTEPSTVASSSTIRFVAAETETPAGWNGTMLTTYSLAAMMANPGLKKTVWAHLKPLFEK